MRWKIITLGTVFLAVAGISGLLADADGASTAPAVPAKLNPAQVPADAQWIIYLNFDQTMQNPEAGKLLTKFLHTHPKAGKNVTHLEKALGVKFPRDFHDVLMLGRTIGPNHGVVVIHATASQQRIEKFFKLNRANITVTAQSDGINKIINKKGHATYEVSPVADTFVVSRSEKSIEHELDVLAGKSAEMAANNPLLVGTRHGLIMYMADRNMAQLANRPGRHPGPVWMKSVTGAWLALRVKKAKLDIVGRMDLKNADSAAQVVQMAQGWQAAMDLGGTNANATPRQRFMAGVADRLNVGAIGKTIRIHWSMSLAKLVAGPQEHPPAAQ